jgi:hypothetical protein
MRNQYIAFCPLHILGALLVALLLGSGASASAQDSSHFRFGGGGHFGINLDEGDPMLGADFLVDLVDISSHVRMSIWPAYTHVFIEDQLDVNLLEVNVPFQFIVGTPIVRPYAAPGLGLSFSDGTSLKLNLIGGCFFHVNDRFEPFTQLAVRLIQGTYVDLIAGVMVRF